MSILNSVYFVYMLLLFLLLVNLYQELLKLYPSLLNITLKVTEKLSKSCQRFNKITLKVPEIQQNYMKPFKTLFFSLCRNTYALSNSAAPSLISFFFWYFSTSF